MIALKDCVQDSESLAKALRKNGESHIHYRMYTSMERAQGIILSGRLFLKNGASWNDIDDRKQMSSRAVYATCFSTSTQENIAMWMLYGAERGKKGAAVVFKRSVIHSILNVPSVSLGYFDDYGKFVEKEQLKRDEYELYMTDIIYKEDCDNGKVNLTMRDEHITVSESILNPKKIYFKEFPWSYENECRMVLEPKHKSIIDERLDTVMIEIPNLAMRKIKKDCVIRSPVYSGAEYGILSKLTGKVDWER